MKTMLLLCAALLTPWAAQAQQIWRCGADGRSYASTPCSAGRMVAINADARPAADVQAAHEAAAREAKLAERLRKERLQQESRALGNGLGSLSAAKPAPLTPAAKAAARNNRKLAQRRPAEADTSTAVAPASRRAKG